MGFYNNLGNSLSRERKLILPILLLCLTSSFFSNSHAQDPTPQPSPSPSPAESPSPTPAVLAIDKAALHQALIDLNSPWTVMCVAAHPDDEDGTTLTVLRRKYGVHTVSLFSTYGEGGQNAVGSELYEELGVIRAQETLKAAQIQGSEPYFLGLKDFGYSKSAEEAFKFWNHDEALKRMVRKIRELRPDVIITNHDTTTGHGHHQATGRLLLEAFTAAADAKSFPEQVSQLGTWQVKRIFVRARRSSTEPQPTADKLVVVDPNEVDQLRGTMFGEQALTALQQHASQGPWPKTVADWLRAQNNQTGKLNLIRYRLERESPAPPPLPNNPKTFLDGLKLSEGAAAMLAPPMIDERPLTEFLDQPDRILDALIIWKRLRPSLEGSAEDAHRFRLISTLRSTALAVASGVSLTLSSLDDALVPGTSTRFSVDAANSGNRLVKLNKLTLDAWTENARLDAADQIVPDSETTVAIDRTTPKTAAVTVPKAEHLYDGKFLGQPFTARAEFELDGALFSLTKELYLDIVPPVEIKSISPSPCVRTPQAPDHCKSFDVSLANHLKSPFKGTINATRSSSGISQNGIQVQLQSLESRFVQATDLNSNSQPAKLPSEESAIEMISVIASGSGQPVTQRAVRISFAAARITPRLRVGYIPSFDRTLELTLAAMGVEAKELTIQDIQQSELDSFDTIIIDNRGYEAHPELIPANSRLLEYVSRGGNLVAFYHKDNEWNPDEKRNRPQLAPYPILIDDNRVTDETAPIRFLRPAHRLLNYPNRITATDFKNWIQERGLYYPKEWDPRYTPIFSTADPGEAELTGGLLVANHGKGTYIYTSMVWYRQLRAGIPGAYRMFANMISYRRGVRGR